MSHVVELIKNQPSFVSLTGTDDTEIAAAEKKLGIKFAPDYRLYLKELALAAFDGHELTGICSSKRLNVVDVTNKNRDQFGNAADGMYVLEEAGIDGIVVFQKEDGSVYALAPGMEPRRIADSISEYITM